MAANRNKSAGSNLERLTVNQLKSTGFFPNVYTSRLASRLRDMQKIDICNGDEDIYNRLQYNIQTKTIQNQPQYQQVLDELPKVNGIINMFVHKKTKKSEGGRFMPVGTYVFLEWEDQLKLIADRERYRIAFDILNEYFDSISDEEKPEVHNKLIDLGL